MKLKPSTSLFTSRKTTALFLTLNLGLFLLFLAQDIQSQSSMSNSSYIIRFPNLNSFSGKTTGDDFKLGVTGGQTAPGLFTGTNFKIRAGFQYINSIIPFTFTISTLNIDFGPLTPGAPVTRTNRLIVSNGSAYGYTVVARQNWPLRANSSGISIPDTTCDSGTCTESSASEWTSLTTFGFGYRCDDISGTDCNTDFAGANDYKQFASSESAELAQPVMTGLNVGRDIESEITYKVNISATQAAGNYENTITYIALPSI
jgi:hypothetical protein